MEKNKLGFTDLELTRIGFGSWAIGGGGWEFGWGPQDERESISAIHRAIDLGVNWIDTAAAYGLGRSEKVVGKAIKGRRDELIIATKCGLVWDEPSSWEVNNYLKAKSVRKEAEDSLRRLDVDVIDLYQIHWPIPDEDIEEAWNEIAKLIDEGKVRFGGVSNFNVEQIQRCQSIHPVASLQPPYNMLEREVEDKLLPFCAQQDIGIVAYSPLASGLLTGKYDAQKIDSLPDDDWRKSRNAHFQKPELSANLNLIDGLQRIGKRENLDLIQLAVAWVLRRPEVTSAIVGARRPDQVEDIVLAGNLELSSELINEIDELLIQRQEELKGVS